MPADSERGLSHEDTSNGRQWRRSRCGWCDQGVEQALMRAGGGPGGSGGFSGPSRWV